MINSMSYKVNGDDASTGASYLEIARVLIDHGAQTKADLREQERMAAAFRLAA